jgi:hypothetical protein
MRRPVAVILLALAATRLHAQTDDPVRVLLARAGEYVAQYRKNFTGVVGELHETQRILRPDGTLKRERMLVCDVLLVPAYDPLTRLPASTRAFRDVISVDGKPVRDRDERLRKLFLSGSRDAQDQALRVAREGARYDIGMRHFFDTLMLPLRILEPTVASRFRFTRTTDGMTFQEVQSPALFRSKSLFANNLKDMFLAGSFVIGESDGAVREASLRAGSEDIEFGVSLRYVEQPDIKMLVPADATETLRQPKRPNSDHTVVTGVYSNFRRFQVTTSEQIAEPATKR